MARKPKEDDQIIDLKPEVKKETFVTRWFKDYAVNNREELKIVCDLTARSAEEQFKMYLKSGNTEVYAVVFYATFVTILDFIRGKEKTHNNFTIEIANSVNLGYTNNVNDDNEKIGNFMPIMEYISVNRNIVNENSLSEDSTATNFIKWKELNIKKTADYYKEIQEKTFALLQQSYKTSLRTSEAVIPLFCIFMDNLTNVLKQKFNEMNGTGISEVSMNVLGLFDIFYSFDEESGQEIIEFSPNIAMKLALKQDDVASRE